jgi:hypothetical protein
MVFFAPAPERPAIVLSRVSQTQARGTLAGQDPSLSEVQETASGDQKVTPADGVVSISSLGSSSLLTSRLPQGVGPLLATTGRVM